MRFEHTEHLLLLLLIPLLILLFRSALRWKRDTIKKVGDELLVKQLIRNFSPQKHAIRFSVVVVAFGCMIIAAANLQSATQTERVSRQGIDVMIALDVSRSMLATDIKPSRLAKAKQFIHNLIDKLENNRVGLVLFAGRAYLQMPLTADHSAAGLYMSNANPDAVPTQGTVIAEALKTCNKAFDDNHDKRYKAVVLITDGEDHGENTTKAAKDLADNGVVIFTVGAGTTNGATIVNTSNGEAKRDERGNVIISRINEQELMDIAGESKGIYQQLNDIDTTVDKLMTQFSEMDTKAIVDNRLLNYRSFFQWFLILAFAGLTAELFISERKKIQ